ncbi:spore germination protein [Bacillota bacterium Lsc_1132]
MSISSDGIHIEIISGGIVNFGGAITIAPISVTKSGANSSQSNSGLDVIDNVATMLTRLVDSSIGEKSKNVQKRASSMNDGNFL